MQCREDSVIMVSDFHLLDLRFDVFQDSLKHVCKFTSVSSSAIKSINSALRAETDFKDGNSTCINYTENEAPLCKVICNGSCCFYQ